MSGFSYWRIENTRPLLIHVLCQSRTLALWRTFTLRACVLNLCCGPRQSPSPRVPVARQRGKSLGLPLNVSCLFPYAKLRGILYQGMSLGLPSPGITSTPTFPSLSHRYHTATVQTTSYNSPNTLS